MIWFAAGCKIDTHSPHCRALLIFVALLTCRVYRIHQSFEPLSQPYLLTISAEKKPLRIHFLPCTSQSVLPLLLCNHHTCLGLGLIPHPASGLTLSFHGLPMNYWLIPSEKNPATALARSLQAFGDWSFEQHWPLSLNGLYLFWTHKLKFFEKMPWNFNTKILQAGAEKWVCECITCI